MAGYDIQNIANPNLEWERDRKFDIGFNLGLFKDQINLEAAYYINRSGNQLTTTAVSTSVGISPIPYNSDAIIQNSGFELTLSLGGANGNIIKTKNFTWHAGTAFTMNNQIVAAVLIGFIFPFIGIF